MKRSLSDSLRAVKARALSAALLLGGFAHAQEPPPPPVAAAQRLPAVEAVRSTRAREPLPEADAIKARIDGEYELRQSFLTALPLEPSAPGAPAHLDQTSRLFHWLRLRPLLLLGDHFEVRGEADVPRGMIYGGEPDAIPDSGTEFDRQQPVRAHVRMLRITARSRLGEVMLGHTVSELGMGLLDNAGDQPRFFGVPVRAATYERLALLSGAAGSQVRVGAAGDLAFEQGRLSLWEGDQLWRVALSARYAPSPRFQLDLLTRYENLRARDDRGGAQLFVFDLSGRVRAPLPGRTGELFGEYEAVYQVGDVAEPTALAGGGAERVVAALAAAARLGVALERTAAFRRYAHLVLSLEWGLASGDADPTDDELNRFTMQPNHAPGLLLFGELLRFKSSRAQALLARQDRRAGQARAFGLATSGGVAGASYLNPVLLVRPLPDLTLKLGGVVATSTTNLVDPSRLARTGERQNFDGGSPLGRSLGSELDLGAELVVPLDQPMELRLSVEGAVAFPGSAFDDADGRGLGTQAITTAGLGLTF
jgi:hypothetical protein